MSAVEIVERFPEVEDCVMSDFELCGVGWYFTLVTVVEIRIHGTHDPDEHEYTER